MITFYDVPLHFNAHACTHVSDARAIYIMQIDFAEVKVLQQQNMLNVHHMHTRVCTVFKWNYEQHLYTHTLIPIINRFASTNEPLIIPIAGFKYSCNCLQQSINILYRYAIYPQQLTSSVAHWISSSPLNFWDRGSIPTRGDFVLY